MDWILAAVVVLFLYYFSVIANASNTNVSILCLIFGGLIAIHCARENGWRN